MTTPKSTRCRFAAPYVNVFSKSREPGGRISPVVGDAVVSLGNLWLIKSCDIASCLLARIRHRRACSCNHRTSQWFSPFNAVCCSNPTTVSYLSSSCSGGRISRGVHNCVYGQDGGCTGGLVRRAFGEPTRGVLSTDQLRRFAAG